jgi:Flp pilus assembly protein TadD
VFTAFCESHTSQISFHVMARLLRAATGIKGLDPHAARAQVYAQVRDADPEDLALFDDLMGIADPDVKLPKIDPDAPAEAVDRARECRLGGPGRPGALRDRGRALDRRGQRVDAGRPHGDIADARE